MFGVRLRSDYVGTQQYEDTCDRLVPREEILTEKDGDKGGDDGLQVGIDRDCGGLQVFHRKGDEEETKGGGSQHDEGHLKHPLPPPGGCIERIHGQLGQGDGNGDDGRNEEHVFHLCHRRVFGGHITRNNQIDSPRKHAEDGEHNAYQVVLAGTKRLTHQHHQHGTGNTQQDTKGLEGRDLLTNGKSGTEHDGHRGQRGDEREINGTGEIECPGGERLGDDEAEQTTEKNRDKVAALHMLFWHEGGNEPEHKTGTQRARGHIAHGGYPLVEQQFGDGNAKAENGVGKEDGAVRLQFLGGMVVHINDLLYRLIAGAKVYKICESVYFFTLFRYLCIQNRQ